MDFENILFFSVALKQSYISYKFDLYYLEANV